VQDLGVVAVGEEGRDLRVGRGASVRASRHARGRIAGDATPPGIGRLGRTGHAGIRQPVAGRHVHHHEGVEQHLQAAADQLGDQPGQAVVARGPAIGRVAVRQDRDNLGLRAGDPGDAPIRRQGALGPRLDLRHHPAGPGPHIGAEPRRHHGDPAQVGAQGLEGVEGGEHVGGALELMPVGGLGPAKAEIDGDEIRIEAELAGAGDHLERADPAVQAVDGADHLEGELRDAVAEIGEGQALEHHVGEAAIGRRGLRPLLGDDQRIGRLIRAAGMDADGEADLIDLPAVRPDPADAGDFRLAQAHREVGEVGVAGGDGLLAAQALGGGGGALHRGVGDLQWARRPDQAAADPGPPVDPGDRVALRGGEAADIGEPRPRDEARMRPGAGQRTVEPRPRDGAEGAPDHSADRPAEGRAHRRPGRGQDESRHGGAPW
jgi:hypothetical protein